MKRFLVVSLLFALLCLPSCEHNELEVAEEKEQAPLLTQKVNTYMLELMEEVYLWESHIPSTLDVRYEFDEYEFFEKLCYRTDDRWSYITEDVESVLEGGEGVETTFGYALSFGKFSNTESYFAIVQYVYPGTPASEAGLKRGSILLKINGEDITASNYTNLYYASTLTLTLGSYQEGSIAPLSGDITMTAKKLTLNPVIASSIVEEGDKKVGYLCYSDFFGGSEAYFTPVLQSFKDANITDLVLDLRYNLGGYLTAALQLVGQLAPVECLDGKTVLISKQWNDMYQKYWADKGRNDMLYEFFPKAADVPVSLNLPRIFILIGTNTASASELTTCGLDPYMDVTTIGNTTRGKYTAAIVFNPTDDASIANWGAQVIVYKYANAKGVTEFKEGFKPDYEVEDVLIGDVQPLGNRHELLFAKALELIGVSSAAPATKSVPVPFALQPDFLSKPSGLSTELIDTTIK